MEECKVYTNNHWRKFKLRYEVPEEILNIEFDYLDDCDYNFIYYRGNWYHISEFMRIDKNAPDFMQNWNGYLNDSFFSGVLIKFTESLDHYQIATFIC